MHALETDEFVISKNGEVSLAGEDGTVLGTIRHDPVRPKLWSAANIAGVVVKERLPTRVAAAERLLEHTQEIMTPIAATELLTGPIPIQTDDRAPLPLRTKVLICFTGALGISVATAAVLLIPFMRP